MEIKINENKVIEFSKVFNEIAFIDTSGNRTVLAMRDGGIDVFYNGHMAHLNNGVITVPELNVPPQIQDAERDNFKRQFPDTPEECIPPCSNFLDECLSFLNFQFIDANSIPTMYRLQCDALLGFYSKEIGESELFRKLVEIVYTDFSKKYKSIHFDRTYELPELPPTVIRFHGQPYKITVEKFDRKKLKDYEGKTEYVIHFRVIVQTVKDIEHSTTVAMPLRMLRHCGYHITFLVAKMIWEEAARKGLGKDAAPVPNSPPEMVTAPPEPPKTNELQGLDVHDIAMLIQEKISQDFPAYPQAAGFYNHVTFKKNNDMDYFVEFNKQDKKGGLRATISMLEKSEYRELCSSPVYSHENPRSDKARAEKEVRWASIMLHRLEYKRKECLHRNEYIPSHPSEIEGFTPAGIEVLLANRGPDNIGAYLGFKIITGRNCFYNIYYKYNDVGGFLDVKISALSTDKNELLSGRAQHGSNITEVDKWVASEIYKLENGEHKNENEK